MGLLAAEISAKTGQDASQFYHRATHELGRSFYQRIDAPATPEQKARLAKLDAAQIEANDLGGEAIETKLSRAPGNDQPIGGVKVIAKNGWFAARPSGTEDVYKIYAESFLGEDHLKQIQHDAQSAIDRVVAAP
jgi:phosphoglucomutase